jgi:hypothetical protein
MTSVSREQVFRMPFYLLVFIFTVYESKLNRKTFAPILVNLVPVLKKHI